MMAQMLSHDMTPEQTRKRKIRLVLLALFLVTVFVIGRYTGVADNVDAERVRDLVHASGAWGWALYVAAFAGGEFIHIPGIVFVVAGFLVYGKAAGFGLVFLAAVASVSFSFLAVRFVGGSPLANIDKPWIRRILARLDDRPIRTVLVLRLMLWLAPPLNYALALTNVRFRDYLIGSALGLVVPLAGVAILFDWLFGGS